MRRRWLPLTLGSVLTACAAAPPPAPAPVAVTPPAPPAPEPWQTIVLPAPVDPYRAAQEPDGTLDVIAGGLRLTVQGESVEFAHDGTLYKIVAHARSGPHWLFATEDGALFRAESFTGPLLRVDGNADEPLVGSYDSEGVLATATLSGRLWLGGPESFRAAPAPADGSLVDVGFVNETFGVAVVAPGGLFRTVDGGASFERVDVGAEAVSVVFPNPDEFVLATTGGMYRVGPSGPAVPHTGPTGQWEHELSDEAAHAIESAFQNRYPLSYAAVFASGALPLSDGTLARVEMESVGFYDRQGQRRVLAFPSRNCEGIQAWGPRVLTRCYSPQAGTYILYAADTGFGPGPPAGGWVELRALTDSTEVIAAADGSTLVTPGSCAGGGGEPGTTPVCFYDGHDWHTVALRGIAQVYSVLGETVVFRALAEYGDDARMHAPVWVAHVRAGGDTDEPREILPDHDDVNVRELLLFPGGALAGVAERERVRLGVFGSVEDGLALRDLPRGVGVSVAFADGARALAAGRAMGELWGTADAGRSWQRLEIPVDGDASKRAVSSPAVLNASQPWLQCGPSVCRAGQQVLWSAPRAVGDFDAPPLRVLSSTHPAEVDSNRATDDAMFFFTRVATMRCVNAAGRERGRGNISGVAVSAQATTPPGRLFTLDGWIDAGAGGASDPLGGTFAPEWTGRDDRGRFTVRSRPAPLPGLNGPPDLRVSESVARARMVSRTMAVLERCEGGMGNAYCDVVVSPRGEPARVIDSTAALFNAVTPGMVNLVAAAPLPDGGAALLLTLQRRIDRAQGRDVLLRLDAHGREVARRGFAWGVRPTTRMLAVSASGPLLVAQTADARDRWTAYGLDPNDAGTVLTATMPPMVTACPNAPDPRAITVYAPGGETSDGVLLTDASGATVQVGAENLRVLVEIAATGRPCLRGVSYWSGDPRDSSETAALRLVGGVPRLRAAGGSLGGVVIGPARDAPLRCTVE